MTQNNSGERYLKPLTWRQLRLWDWMRKPEHPELPTGPAINYRGAMWRTSALVRLSGVQAGYTHARCRHDLEALHAHGLIERLDRNGPWYCLDERALLVHNGSPKTDSDG